MGGRPLGAAPGPAEPLTAVILVDTSAWVELLRRTGSPVHRQLGGLLDDGAELATTELVVMELLAGARTPQHAVALRARLFGMPMATMIGLADAEDAAWIYRACREGGETIRSLTDCLIAAVAIRLELQVLHRDRDFDVIARHTELVLL